MDSLFQCYFFMLCVTWCSYRIGSYLRFGLVLCFMGIKGKKIFLQKDSLKVMVGLFVFVFFAGLEPPKKCKTEVSISKKKYK